MKCPKCGTRNAKKFYSNAFYFRQRAMYECVGCHAIFTFHKNLKGENVPTYRQRRRP